MDSFVLLVSGGLLFAVPQYCCVGRGHRCTLYKENITNCLPACCLSVCLSECRLFDRDIHISDE